MDNVRANNATTNGSTSRADSSNISSAENAYAQAMQRILEQQQMANLADINQAAASSMLAYNNPYVMASLATLGAGFSGMPPLAGLPGMAGMIGPDYQSAMAAMAGSFPAAAMYSPATLAYPSMPFTAADYASTLAAYASSLASNPSQITQSSAVSSDREHASPILSNRSSAGGAARSGSSRQSTPLRTSSTPLQSTTLSHRATPTDPSSTNKSLAPSPKKPRLSGSKRDKTCAKEVPHTDMDTFYKGLTADEFDVNTHFKNSLGNLYDNGLLVDKQSSPVAVSSSHLHDTGGDAAVDEESAGLDLSVKSKPTATAGQTESSCDTNDTAVRKSVIQVSKPLIPATVSSTRLSDASKLSHSSEKASLSALGSQSKPYSKISSDGAAGERSGDQYSALPNLKRLSEQLKNEPSEVSLPSNETKSKNVLSLLKRNPAAPAETKVKRRARKAKASIELPSTTLPPMALSQPNLEEERDEIKRKLERDMKQPRFAGRGSQKAGRPLQKRGGGRGRGRRRVNQARQILDGQDMPPEQAMPEPIRPKRSYIRTKISKEKPVNMEKLMIPFEYDWRRETRLRGISKSGKIIGEVFYYTPSDKRVRSYNDVHKYLKQVQESYKRGLTDEKGLPIGSKASEDSLVAEEERATPPISNNHLIDKSASTNDSTATTGERAVTSMTNGWPESEQKEKESSAPKTRVYDSSEDKTHSKGMKMPHQWEMLTKEHFSFNTRVKLGDFMEQKPGEKYVLLNDTERDERIESSNEKRNKQLEKFNKMKAKKEAVKETARRLELAKVEKERKHMETAQRSLQAKLKKQLEKARSKAQHELLKQQRAVAVQMRKKQLQEERDRDRLEKQERSKHLLEIRERQRLSLINSKLMETRRREEERRRLHMDKIIQKERKHEIRKRQLELTRELKQPTEDLRLPNVKALPTLNRIPGMKLPAKVFANVLQFHQFITNFYDCLELKHSIPTLNMLQQALLADNRQSKQALDKVLCHLLGFGLSDPGVRNSAKFTNELGQKLSKCIVDEFNFSEILRIFIMERNGSCTRLSRELETKPFVSLTAELKSEAMVWLCDELNTSQAVTNEIDNNMEQVLNHRRDKWELEGKIREVKTNATLEGVGKASRPKDMDQSDQSDNDEDQNTDQLPTFHSNKSQTSGTPTKQMGEDKPDGEDKKLEKLLKQYSKCCKDVVTRSSTVRTFPYGMDRYRRYYWCLPSFKGILVESSESSVHKLSSDPTDLNLTLKSPAELPPADSRPEVDKESISQNVLEASDATSLEPATSSISTSILSTCASSIACDKTISPSNFDLSRSVPNGLKPSNHSISSWLSSAIDQFFAPKSTNNSSSQSSSPCAASTSAADLKPTTSNSSVSMATGADFTSSDGLDTWFELDRKLPCDKLQRFSSQLIANSLAFMNCVTGSEEQKELEALERLAAKAALLDQARPLPPDVQKGWWIITDSEQVKSVSTSLHPRALRERLLNRSLNKHKEKIEIMCSDQNMRTDVDFECDERDSEIAKSAYQAVVVDDSSTWLEKQCRPIELTILDKVEDLEERVYQASIYTKNWADKKKHDATDLELVVTPATEVAEGQKRIIDLVKEKLLLLEAGVERRYLKPPFIKSTTLHLADIVSSKSSVNGTGEGSDADSEDTAEDSKASEDNCSKGLLDWQRAVRGAVNMSQLYISLVQLETCIAWEKSVMRVLCQVCRSDDKEDQLLLCDSCDKGYHTYCFRPKMLTIPNGDWYCWECKSKASSIAHCIRCGKPTGKMAQCHKCPQAIHLDCCSPSLSRVPRKYTCGHCLQLTNQNTHKRRRRSKHKTYESASESDDMAAQESTDEEREEDSADMSVCREIMTEIESHKDAEPFLEPVDTKAFPQYKKYIKQPMDLSKISEKLTNNQYASQVEFYDDMILIFDNCLLFNEDSSVVGKSGKVLRRLFQKRWKQSTSS
ncbi:bromodomain adjacent to zinc finger domain protein 2B-like isoform X2 [Watersipora subatra]|uniref:bromodomain adjacent to zinc finger domain protein 2B-like isoform X2 n=1 Tax=Watersipora subatra TaxID=2589382 RepID=UPI00355BF8B6